MSGDEGVPREGECAEVVNPQNVGGDSVELDTTGGTMDTTGDDMKYGPTEEYLKLPETVKRRVRALKKLLYENVKIDAEFYKEMFELEKRYDVQHQIIFEKRKALVNGEREPADDECDWPSDLDEDSDEEEKLCDAVKSKAVISNGSDIKGIPNFWLTALKNTSMFDDMIKEHDEDILKHLTDIKCILHSDEPGFTLEFYFSPNEYFTNRVLTKRYYFNYEISPTTENLEYDGPDIARCRGCAINWNPGKNVTVKIIKKVQKRKSSGAKRTITKKVQEDSFFNFFNMPSEALSDDLDEDIQMLLETDFRLGQFLRDTVIPRAVLYFTGEAVDSLLNDEDEDDEDDDEDDDDDDEDEEDQDEDDKHHRNRKTHHHRPGNQSKSENPADQPPECKQQ
ncbi:unnamed protein product [Calicophoron daubneyi]|uniref:Nucleosome assembly protein 1-like 1 n=1 Tax=Calicophoron daubneyi TaxID=300641 RepID=A0AAV2TFC3_CALDB